MADDPRCPKSRARAQVWWLFGWVTLLTVLFSRPLTALFFHAIHSDLHSHIVLVPFVVAYLIHLRRPQLPKRHSSAPLPATLALVAGGASLVTALWLSVVTSVRLSENDYLGLMALAYVC